MDTVAGPADELGVSTLVRFARFSMQALASAREELDALNVYPVPDGDTGTNLFLTFEAAHGALRASLEEQGGEPEWSRTLRAYSRGLLLGARGNSGVIMSQLVGALLARVERADSSERAAVVIAQGIVAGADAAYAAVGRPVEGTILSVARAAAAEAARAVADPAVRTGAMLGAARRAAREALARTPEQLETLRRAGVVDAGGTGLCLVLDAAESAFTGRRELDDRSHRRWVLPDLSARGGDGEGPADGRGAAAGLPAPGSSSGVVGGALAPGADLVEGGPAYEVMYLLDASPDAVARLRATLDSLGDSLVVVGDDDLWNVHVHVDDVGAAVEAGIEAGRPHRIRVTHFADQVAQSAGTSAPPLTADGGRRPAPSEPLVGAVPPTPSMPSMPSTPSMPSAVRKGRAVVVVAFGAGLARLFAEGGATVVRADTDRRPSAGELLEAVLATGAGEVVLVPNDRDVVPSAEAAARLAEQDAGIKAAVIATSAQVQGMAALAVHEPGRTFEQDLVEMAAAARHARSGAVTVAARAAMTTAGPCRPGDVLGAVEGDFVVVGADQAEVACEVADRLLGGGGELFTVLAGRDGEELARRCAEHVALHHPTVDIVVYDGGQDRYPLLLGVE